MTETGTPRQQDATASVPGPRAPRAQAASGAPQYDEYGRPITSGWASWVAFAGVMLIVLGFFHAIEGLVALFQDKYFAVRPSGLVVHVNDTAWAARVVGVIIAGVSAIVDPAFIAAQPA
ncbi:DUF7144 family membrane protein [Geodermatophilus ruber]|uniref:DUF7144 domain-containing protein n=1 Tax=Geodermatophilus ruber TaxID=504800 RepID=A0A1I4BGV7_9ACTN|nr:hypothetical protein [Geodermatophilus ruber]SFK68065.1 hypothetical protein SAMN04488085_10340 [Geodermatophilus ruber]